MPLRRLPLPLGSALARAAITVELLLVAPLLIPLSLDPLFRVSLLVPLHLTWLLVPLTLIPGLLVSLAVLLAVVLGSLTTLGPVPALVSLLAVFRAVSVARCVASVSPATAVSLLPLSIIVAMYIPGAVRIDIIAPV